MIERCEWCKGEAEITRRPVVMPSGASAAMPEVLILCDACWSAYVITERRALSDRRVKER